MNDRTIGWCRAAGRVVALLAGAAPVDVWPSYETFEEDMSILFDNVEDVYNTAKPDLEERERKALREYQESKK